MVPASIRRLVRFGPFELDRQSGELRKHGIRVRIQTKCLQLLLALLDRPGEVVTRDELRSRLWEADTFVDFENGLNTIAARLRQTLGDSSDSPRYVETLAKTGYRFIAPVSESESEPPPLNFDLPVQPQRPAPKAARGPWVIAGLAALVAIVAVLWSISRPAPLEPAFRPLMFRRGQILGAKFAPDGDSVLYTARWSARSAGNYLVGRGPESQFLELPYTGIIAVSRDGDLLVFQPDGDGLGTIFRTPMNARAPAVVERRVASASWTADGKQIAITRRATGGMTLEFPIGKTIYKTSNEIGLLRVSPSGSEIAFQEYELPGTNTLLKMVDRDGQTRVLASGFSRLSGLAWKDEDVWFTAARTGSSRSLWKVKASGGEAREVLRAPGSFLLRDISPSGKFLLTTESVRVETHGRLSGDDSERDLSWFDWSNAKDLSRDGTALLFEENGAAIAPARRIVFVRRAGQRNAVRIGEGTALAISPDALEVAMVRPDVPSAITFAPSGGGASRTLNLDRLRPDWARYFPDGSRLLVCAAVKDSSSRLYVVDKASGQFRPLSPPLDFSNAAISPDGRQIAVKSSDLGFQKYDAATGVARTIPMKRELFPILWMSNGNLLARERATPEAPTVPIWRIRPSDGSGEVVEELRPWDSNGANSIWIVVAGDDGKSIAFSAARYTSELYLVSGIH